MCSLIVSSLRAATDGAPVFFLSCFFADSACVFGARARARSAGERGGGRERRLSPRTVTRLDDAVCSLVVSFQSFLSFEFLSPSCLPLSALLCSPPSLSLPLSSLSSPSSLRAFPPSLLCSDCCCPFCRECREKTANITAAACLSRLRSQRERRGGTLEQRQESVCTAPKLGNTLKFSRSARKRGSIGANPSEEVVGGGGCLSIWVRASSVGVRGRLVGCLSIASFPSAVNVEADLSCLSLSLVYKVDCLCVYVQVQSSCCCC